MHMLHLLEEDGTLGVILPSGVLCASTPGVIEFRKFLVENQYIDTIIQLPLNIFPYVSETTITYILIIQKCVENQKHQIRFIDASEMHERIKSGISLRQLGKKNIKDIMEMVSQNKKNDKMSIANIEQIRKNNYVLTTNLYCSNHLQENKEVNIKNIAIFKREIELLETKKNNLSQKIQQIEKEIELFFENSKERKEIAIKDIIQEITKTNKDSFPYDICSLDCKKGLILRDNNKQFKKN
ncbi:hypothetical protein HPP_0040 [Hydrangea phyllody phytoplasma]|uniref:site-specific DNA-methyltransferase (adenine-specific) n=2 Tax=16SrI (Aster yellows group) TaxID=3042590 RepID=A0ABQ5PT60_9MOLU|nr:N-6 DNA methylase [Hydrangea phyllody phytoplasma]GFZ75046.1 hypothetical protein HPP_0040 [Hydrangea phyllody phytoplasma]GLH61112.1 hypothetical protein RHYP_0570 [Rhus yellows phytoplasma]GLH61926.1 hypothetical protein HP2P_3330 [Hydrangea phyllody phytoplasma]